MKQYLIYALDFTDSHALERRLQVRPEHFKKAKEMKKEGTFILGGAILNDDGQMIGSTMILQFEDDQALENWVKTEPYILGKVWDKVDIRPFKVADI